MYLEQAAMTYWFSRESQSRPGNLPFGNDHLLTPGKTYCGLYSQRANRSTQLTRCRWMSTFTVVADSFRTHPLRSSMEDRAIDNLPDAPLFADSSDGTGIDTLDWPVGISMVTLSAFPDHDLR